MRSRNTVVRKLCCWLIIAASASCLDASEQVRQRRASAAADRQADTAYEGREEDAAWRREAKKRIERIRKADLVVKVVDAAGKPVEGAIVDVKMQRHFFGFGSAVVARWLSVEDTDAESYRGIVEENYNKVVFENDLKWQPWDVSKTDNHAMFRQQWLNSAFQWLDDHDIEVRGHYITWAPLDRTQAKFIGRPDELRSQLWAHMEEKLPAVGKRASEWDSINHIVGWGETFASVCGGNQIYADIIKKSRQLAPHAELWVNEGQVLSRIRSDEYEKVIQFLVEHDAAPDGIGFMGHFSRRSLQSPELLLETFDRFARLVPNLQLTELDVQVGDDEALQADYLRDVMTVAFSHPALQGIIMWGFWEGRHWKPDAALYRRDWSIKPAGQMWLDLVKRDWWTNEVGNTDSQGRYTTRGFLGEYMVMVEHETRQRKQMLSLPSEGKELVMTFD